MKTFCLWLVIVPSYSLRYKFRFLACHAVDSPPELITMPYLVPQDKPCQYIGPWSPALPYRPLTLTICTQNPALTPLVKLWPGTVTPSTVPQMVHCAVFGPLDCPCNCAWSCHTISGPPDCPWQLCMVPPPFTRGVRGWVSV